MSKRKDIIAILLILALTVLSCVTAGIGLGREHKGSAKNIKTGLDLAGGVSITYEADEDVAADDMDDTIWKLQQRVQNYSTESNVYKEGSRRINVEIPGVTDANAILAELGTPGSLYFIAEKDADGNENYTSGENGYELTASIEDLKKNGSVVCEGSDVADAQGVMTQDSVTKNTKAVVDLVFTKEGTQKFADATTKAFSAGESIGIYYDGRFVSIPKVNAAITDGKAIIEGMGGIEEAKELASYIRIGGLKVELHEIRSNVVGAQLGHDAIRTSLIGGAIGLALVCLIMLIVYLFPGFIASWALVLYITMMMVLLNAFDLTLTLPGIAGVILGIGMAVDANVIIYSRIQEEIGKGASVGNAVRAGFDKAMSAILDGNITTLIAAAVLGAFGTGTIKGFAMTLALSVVLSMFTALVISRFLCYAFANHVPVKYWARKKHITTIDFVSLFKKTVLVPALVVVIGVVCLIANKGLNLSMEFTGGTATTITMDKEMTKEEAEDKISPILQDVIGESGSGVSFQKVIGANEIIVKTRTMSVEERDKFSKELADKLDIKETAVTAESISATVGKEMRRSAVMAVVLAIILMLFYIFIRFHGMSFSLAAILALCHDVLITLMLYAIARITVGNAFIAVMLTILGYSINSTIVIFDRIREIRKVSGRDSKETIVNNAINVTLTRSIFTNLTTLVSISALFILGVSSIKEFTLPMMAGIIAGTFSSVFMTGPLWLMLDKKKKN